MAVNVFFLRVSSSTQQLESQFDEVWDYYSKQDNLDRDSIRVIEYKESGVKLSEEERLGITDLKKLVETVGVDCIYVSELSRVARTEKVLWSFVDYLEKNKIQLKCKNPEFCLLNEDRTAIPFNSRLMVSTFGTLATQEAIEKKRRFARGKARKAKEGKYNGGAIPYGYRINKEKDNLIEPDEGGEADVVREIFNLYENGMSQPAIAKELFKRGVKGRAARATKRFTISLVHQILTNDLLTGKPHLSKGASYERTYPMIVTPEQFERCRKIAEMNNMVTPKSLRVYYAHRLIKCLECGRYFVSTGSKGYYHCWDAYYPYREFNGSEGTPRCKNRVCISVNIMDSLLWELAQEYETTFILNSAQQKLSECEKAKAVIEQKLAALPMLRQSIDERMDYLLDALAEGMKPEKFQPRKKALLQELKELEKEEAEYKEQIARFDNLIEEVKTSLNAKDVFETEEDIDGYFDNIFAVKERVSSITDDEERSRIIHRHIEKVTVEASTFNYKFGIHPEGKDAFAKKITIHAYMDSGPREFYFVPYNGKGGVMLTVPPNAGKTEYILGKAVEIPLYQKFEVAYLPRIIDKGKYRRREIERANRENIKNRRIEQLRKQGYISMNEMMAASKLSYSTLYNAIKDGKMEGTNLFKTWYVKQEDFNAYLQKYKPQARPQRQTTKAIPKEENLTPEQKLLRDVLNYKEDK